MSTTVFDVMEKIDGIRSTIQQIDERFDIIAQVFNKKLESRSKIFESENKYLNDLYESLQNIQNKMDGNAYTNTISSSSSLSPSNQQLSKNADQNQQDISSNEKIKGGGINDASFVEASPFPTLFCENMSGGDLHMVVNSARNIQIDNEFFEGEALLAIRVPGEPLTHHQFRGIFEGKQRTIELQVQGRFKRPPRGEIFVGGEITAKMQLGLVKRGICSGILAFMRKFIRGIHVSFGDDENFELPHIVAPFTAGCDRLLVSYDPGSIGEKQHEENPGICVSESIPKLGMIVPETDADRSVRRSGKAAPQCIFDKGTTVTFSFNTMYVDLQRWEVCKLPMLKSKSLTDFWSNSDLQFVVYDVPKDREHDEVHPAAENKYVAKLRMMRVENGNAEKFPRFAMQQKLPAVPLPVKQESTKPLIEESSVNDFPELSDESDSGSSDDEDEFVDCSGFDDDEMEYDPSNKNSGRSFEEDLSNKTTSPNSGHSTQRRRGSFEAKIKSLVSLTKSVSLSKKVDDDSTALSNMSGDNDMRWKCIGWVDLCERKNVNTKSAYYILVGTKKLNSLSIKTQLGLSSESGDGNSMKQGFNGEKVDIEGGPSRMVLRTSRECEELLKAAALIERDALLNGSFADSIGSYEDALVGGNGAGNESFSSDHGERDTSPEEAEQRGATASVDMGEENEANRLSSFLTSKTISEPAHGSRLSNREKMRRKIDHALKRFGKAGGTSVCLLGDASGLMVSDAPSPTASSASSGVGIGMTSNNNADNIDMKRNGNILIPSSLASTLRPYGLLSTPPKHLVQDGLVCFAVSESHWAESWLTVRHHVIDLHDPVARKRILRIANKDIIEVNVSSSESDDFGDDDKKTAVRTRSYNGIHHSGSLIGGVFGECDHALPSCGVFVTIELVTSARVFYIVVRQSEKQKWLDSIGAVVSPVFAARLEWCRYQKKLPPTSPRALSSSSGGNASIGNDDEDGCFNSFLERVLPPERSLLVTLAVGDSRQAFCVIGPQKWKHEKRKVLNCRRFYHQSNPFKLPKTVIDNSSSERENSVENREGSGSSTSAQTNMQLSPSKDSKLKSNHNIPHPLSLVENLLYYLLHHVPSNITMGSFQNVSAEDSDTPFYRERHSFNNWMYPETWSFEEFSDFTCLLKLVDLSMLKTKEELLCFNLNLYHILVKHSQIIFGPPDSVMSLAKFTSRGCYEVGNDVVTVGELEHCVLRASMSSPDQIGANLFIPKGAPYSFRLWFSEPRLNFAMNIGSRCFPPLVPIYKPGELNKQLDDITKFALRVGSSGSKVKGNESGGVLFNASKGTVTLPKIMQWYRFDFGNDPLTLVKFSKNYLSSEQALVLDDMLNGYGFGSKKLKVKFHDYSPTCSELMPFEGNKSF